HAEAGFRGELVELPDLPPPNAACHEAFPEVKPGAGIDIDGCGLTHPRASKRNERVVVDVQLPARFHSNLVGLNRVSAAGWMRLGSGLLRDKNTSSGFHVNRAIGGISTEQ